MVRVFYILCVSVLLASAAFVYGVKYEVQGQMRQASDLERKIAKERDSIAMLRAEWSHLNQPSRLQALAQKHLNMKTMDVQQIGKLADVPVRAGPNVASVEQIPLPPSTIKNTKLQ